MACRVQCCVSVLHSVLRASRIPGIDQAVGQAGPQLYLGLWAYAQGDWHSATSQPD